MCRVDLLCAQHHCRVQYHVLEVAKWLLQTLRSLLDGLVRRLQCGERCWEMLVRLLVTTIAVRVVR